MFYGSHAINMDAKGRIAIPTRVRDLLQEHCAGKLVLTAHTENRCLHLFPEPHWQDLLPKIEAWPSFNKKARRAKLLLLGHACPLVLDASGRVLVPPTLREYAALEKKLMLVGQGKSLELWSDEHFRQYLDESADDDDMPESMQTLAL
ncbi:MAG: division/cell wall cluster transcriptional repressor MraZ [Cellvibrionaceae bacterium]|nr:division/cell wall cluster transcriptional repressor MraZ [Cellvibrionaceae bacterium]